ncbi:MAG: aminoglycoside phosphotransferase family protein [Candidatus Helarchaeales archaeon]
METTELVEILRSNPDFTTRCGKNFKLNLISDKYNLIYSVQCPENLHVKVGLRGWGLFEWRIINLLHEQNYLVPRPICFIPIRKHRNENWAFGSLEQVDGIIVCHPIRGTDLWNSFSMDNLKRIILLLKKLHRDDSLKVPPIENYQKAEIMRGLHYARQFDFGQLQDKLIQKLKKYDDIKLDKRFIHGDARPDHFIFTNEEVGMIDFEGACMGDPIKDFGTLTAELLNGNLKIKYLQDLFFPETFNQEMKERFEFFMIRRLLVKLKYENSIKARNLIEKIVAGEFQEY